MSKGPDAFRTISEVAEELDLPQHVLRFWETRFTQIKPMKRGGGRRYYRPDDVELLRGIRRLLYGEGYTIKGVQRILKEQGPRHVTAAGQDLSLDPAPEGDEPDAYGDDFQDPGFEPPSEMDEFDDEIDAGDLDRREPLFEPRIDSAPGNHAVAPAVRGSGERPVPQDAAFHGRAHASEPAKPAPSRIPAAPPDLPSSAEDYLPPLVADLPVPPERGAHPGRPQSPYAPPPASSRRETLHAPDLGYDEADMSMNDAATHGPAERGGATRSPGLGQGDRERLQATLLELLECKRILDNVR